MRSRLAFALALLACACGGAESSSDFTPASSDLASVPPQTLPRGPHLVAAPTDGALPLSFSLDAVGRGSRNVGAMTVRGASGQVEVAGQTTDAAVVAKIPFAGDEVYEVLAVASDRWSVLWVYCDAGALRGVYVESTAAPGAVIAEPMTGSCEERPESITVPVRFPAFDVAAPALVSPGRFAVHGAAIDYDGEGAGAMTIGGTRLDLFPFSVVDCTHGCGGIGWYELHSLLWDEASGKASFGIVYLYEDRSYPVELAYTLTLPTLTRYGDSLAFPDATWTK